MEKILKIPLSPKVKPDVIIWHYENYGIFLVKTAYHMGIEYMAREAWGDNAPTTSHGSRKLMWSLLWNIKIPPNSRLQGWKVFQGTFPTGVNLKRQLRLEEAGCPRCGRMRGTCCSYIHGHSKFGAYGCKN